MSITSAASSESEILLHLTRTEWSDEVADSIDNWFEENKMNTNNGTVFIICIFHSFPSLKIDF